MSTSDRGGILLVMNELPRFVSDPHTCAYLPDRLTTLEYTCDPALTPEAYEALMDQGYRKFGIMIFRPVCSGCSKCRPIRVDVQKFKPSRSQRRAMKKNEDLEVKISRPVLDQQHLDLYRRYHEKQHERKAWELQNNGPDEYIASFLQNPLPNIEVSLWQKKRLCAVALTDITPNTVSAIYHYHEPELAARSIGTFCLLQVIDLARQLKRRWVYLGYYVSGCSSMEYKNTYRPCEIMNEAGEWLPFHQRQV